MSGLDTGRRVGVSSVEVFLSCLDCVQPSKSPSGLFQVECFLQSFPQKIEEMKRREEGEENILWEWLYNICFSALRLGFEEEEYSGSEGPTNQPCRVVVHLQNTTTEAPLTLRLFPQTTSENVAASGPLPTSTLSGANASSKTMWLHLRMPCNWSLPPLVPKILRKRKTARYPCLCLCWDSPKPRDSMNYQ